MATDNSHLELPSGWSVKSWANHLRMMAWACESLHPDQAAEYRTAALELEKKLNHGATKNAEVIYMNSSYCCQCGRQTGSPAGRGGLR